MNKTDIIFNTIVFTPFILIVYAFAFAILKEIYRECWKSKPK